MKMRSRRQVERDRARREARRRLPRTEQSDETDEVEPIDDAAARTLLGYDD